eukprot:scaffold2739_cov257-Pinguiococcus_pyrenoidosus.AAC.36
MPFRRNRTAALCQYDRELALASPDGTTFPDSCSLSTSTTMWKASALAKSSIASAAPPCWTAFWPA